MKIFYKSLDARSAVRFADALAKDVHAVYEVVNVETYKGQLGLMITLQGDTIPQWLKTEDAIKRTLGEIRYKWWMNNLEIIN